MFYCLGPYPNVLIKFPIPCVLLITQFAITVIYLIVLFFYFYYLLILFFSCFLFFYVNLLEVIIQDCPVIDYNTVGHIKIYCYYMEIVRNKEC